MEANLQLLSQDKDRYFMDIENLSWLPWVGVNYLQSKRRVLIIAESHYNVGDNIETKNLKTMRKKWQTRDVVQYYPIAHKENNSMFENLHRCLFQTININRENIWKHIAFYNFIQRPMDYNIKERPNESDWEKGWDVFFEIIKILKPTDCIFVGVGAADRFNEYMYQKRNIEYEKVKWMNVENSKRYARKFAFKIDDIELSCLAIQHTSHHFSWSAWNKFLQQHSKLAINYLTKLANVTAIEQDDSVIDDSWTNSVPCWLNHKPILICNGKRIEKNSDLQYISVGRSQWDNESSASVKTYRKWEGARWSRMSEEIPIERLPDMMLLLLSAIKYVQDKRKDWDAELETTYLQETPIKEDWEFIENQLAKNEKRISNALNEIKRLLDKIDTNDI